MDLQTFVKRPVFDEKISYDSRTLFLGSCFSNNIADKLERLRFSNLVNPFGTIYQPEAIFQLISYALDLQEISDDKISEVNSYYFHDDAHSQVYADSKDLLMHTMKDLSKKLRAYIDASDYIFLTFGSSFSYRKNRTQSLVANCHKQAAQLFNKEFRDQGEIVAFVQPILEHLKHKKIVLTVSPVRHLRDGLVDNQVSKANLRMLCQSLEKSFDNIVYYPSYEIFIDELRDYRFFKSDMIHPNEIGIEYIWNYFVSDFISKNTVRQMKQYEKLRKSIDHRPLKENDLNYLNHLNSLLKKLRECDFINLKEDIKVVEKRIKDFS